jgi:hypothetical protein
MKTTALDAARADYAASYSPHGDASSPVPFYTANARLALTAASADYAAALAAADAADAAAAISAAAAAVAALADFASRLARVAGGADADAGEHARAAAIGLALDAQGIVVAARTLALDADDVRRAALEARHTNHSHNFAKKGA